MIVEASKLPVSVIIIGIGDENFDQMDELDSDDKILKDKTGRSAVRDTVQFVRFREAVARGNLAEEVLKEIPAQVSRYMEYIDFKVKPLIPDLD